MQIHVPLEQWVFKGWSGREIEVLKYLTDGKRNIEIAQQLKINQKTVNTYKNWMMRKL
jgi:DNA-binding CsgD family transcriptional regulator